MRWLLSLFKVRRLLNDMFDAEERSGCGFYSDGEWVKKYDAIRNILGREDRFIHIDEE